MTLTVHADRVKGTLQPIWRFIGYDEANYTFHPEGRQLLDRIARLAPQPYHIRTHHLLTSGNGEVWLKWSSSGAYDEDTQGRPVYRWEIVDRIFDTLRERGLKPYVEIAFMPRALSVQPEPYTNPRVTSGRPRGAVGNGWAYPPKDYARWAAFIEAWARHCAERYGRAEAESWFWELWNEPDIAYWKGTPEDYFRLYDYTAAAVKRALPNGRMGGPHVTNPTGSERFLRAFIEHCLRGTNAVTGGVGAPLDFIAFHAKGGTRWVDGHVQMNLGNHLRVIDRGCAIVADYPELRGKPVIVGESDPDGCAACAARFYPQNGYRNGSQYAAYLAAVFLRNQPLAERRGVNLQGAVTWAFTFPGQPWFEGFRTLATHNVPKPVFNAFRMFSLLERERLALDHPRPRSLEDLIAHSVRAEPDVDAVATRGRRAVSVLVWHYHDEGVPGPEAQVTLRVEGLPASASRVTLHHYRVDDEHSNAYTVWHRMGSPQQPTTEQYQTLLKASELALLEPARELRAANGRIELPFTLPRQGLSLVRLTW